MTNPRRNTWSRQDIRAARRVPLAPLLHKRGLVLRDRGGGNMETELYKGILIKAWFWRWPERDMSGNAIDFYTQVLGTSFNEAMREILE